jgi:thioredoxin reductase
LFLEISVVEVFAVGDVHSGSVASAVGEGSMAV